ncbi:MAG: hypothetical protein ACLFWG_03240 [Longimicrobiales bacterium]
MARSFHVDLPEAGRVEVSPGAVRRHLLRNGASFVESVIVLRRLPGVLLQWGAPGRGEPPDRAEWNLGWTLPPNARAELPGATPGPLLVHLGLGADASLRVEVEGGEARWTLASPDETGGASRVSLRAVPREGVPLTLLFALDSGDGRRHAAVTSRLSSLDAELTARVTADTEAAATELSLAVDDPDSTESFQWARRRLHGSVGHTGDGDIVLVDSSPPDSTGIRLAPVGHGLLALGRHREAGELVEHAVTLLTVGGREHPSPEPGAARPDRGRNPSGTAPHAPRPREAANLLLLLGRYVLWTGDARPLRRLGGNLERWLARPGRHDGGPPPPSHPPSSLTAPGFDAALRECAEAVEAAGERSRAEELRQLGATKSAGRRAPGSPPDTSLDPTTLLFGLLGARADAFFGRLRLAPRLPGRWRRMSVGGIRMGDARVHLSYHADGGRHTFRLEPTGGRVPVNLVFEPQLPVARLEGAWVDGSPAELELFRGEGRAGTRLQLPLDAPRAVVLQAKA